MKLIAAETEMATKVARPCSVSAAGVLACAWPALLLATLCLLPFLNKAFNIDDPHFLTMAQQIVKHPMHPMDFTICWNAPGTCAKAYTITPGDALMGYVLVPTVLDGAQEWVAHLTQLALCWIAIIAMASLILRFGWSRRYATAGALLLVAIPPFLPMASTAMPDILATTLAVLAMERLAAWKAEQKTGQGVVAAIALGLAGFARPHLVLLLPLAAFYLLESIEPRAIAAQIRRRAWLWAPVIAGLGLLVACILAVREHNLAINPPPSVIGWGHIPMNLSAYLLYLTFPIPLAACWLVNRLKSGRRRTVAIVLTVALAVGGATWLMGLDLAFAWSLAVVGCGAMVGQTLRAWRSRDQMAIFLTLWVLIPLPIVIYAQLPIKYLLPCMPAVILLCFRLTDGIPLRVSRMAIVGLIVAGTGYSVLILRADAEFAEYGRNALRQMITPHVQAGETVWYPGQYWSYWYAPLDGAKLTFPGGPQPRPGDFLAVDVFSTGVDGPLSRFPDRALVETISHKYWFGRTMGAGMGLYSNGLGYWLWGFGEDKRDRYELWRID